MYAPRAKFERIYVVSPIKVIVILLISFHCLCLFITFPTTSWVKTKHGRYGPLYRCEKRLITNNYFILYVTSQCYSGGFVHDRILLTLPIIGVLIMASFFIAFISIIAGSLSFIQKLFSIRHELWLCTIILILFICLIDWFILGVIPWNYRGQIYHFQWAYGIHCSATLIISSSLVIAILMYNTDDIHYIEEIDYSAI